MTIVKNATMNLLNDIKNTHEFIKQVKSSIDADIVRLESGDDLAILIMKNNQWLTVSIDEDDTEEDILTAVMNYDWAEPPKVDFDFEILKSASRKLESYKEFLGAEIVRLTQPNAGKEGQLKIEARKDNAWLNIHIAPNEDMSDTLQEIDDIFKKGNIATKMYSASYLGSYSQGVRYGSCIIYALSYDEAVGKALNECKKTLPDCYNHAVAVFEVKDSNG